jgi:hypothetical protein
MKTNLPSRRRARGLALGLRPTLWVAVLGALSACGGAGQRAVDPAGDSASSIGQQAPDTEFAVL